jgi:hypothetical protein
LALAQSPTHRFGQIIGAFVEELPRKQLEAVARKHRLYLDFKHARPARDGSISVCWSDYKGNAHDLDYVFEAGGSEEVLGRPKAFIEIAYRRYTKHSRNKAQEIQGAIGPLSDTYKDDHPFLGAILAGVFTDGSLTQLRSHGFSVLYFPFESIVTAFSKVGVDAFFDEDSPDSAVKAKVAACERLSPQEWEVVARTLKRVHRKEFEEFMGELDVSLKRSIKLVFVLALHGQGCEVRTVEQAIQFIEAYEETGKAREFVRYEVNVRYTNGDEIRGTFESKSEAVKFLNSVR